MATTQERSPSKSKRRVTTAAVPKSMIEKASLTLADLPEKPKETLQLREAIQLLVDPITAALAKGYSREEVVTLLNDKGIEITPASLQYYMLRFRQQAPKTKGKTRKPRRTKAEKAAEAAGISTATPAESTATESVAAAETAPTPAKRRGPAKGTPKPPSSRAAAKAKPSVAEKVVEPAKATKPTKAKTTKAAKTSEATTKTTAKKTSSTSTPRKPRSTQAKPKSI
ncbi:MAG: hypothetical protein SFY66_16435 [Oculatellaceae cyanobacterium bins.114]|nr:hypothetical protein [Oculatellaceae cyanobacterium bins.114]